MAYYMVPALFDHAGLARRLDHLFLIRDPRKAVLSYYRLDPNVSSEEIGIAAQWRLYHWLCRNCNRAPMIIEAEAVQQNLGAAMEKVWNYLGLSMKSEALTWDAQSTPEDWAAVSGWHSAVQASTGIRKVAAEDEAAMVNRFNQAAKKAPRLQALPEHHWPYYLKLKEASEKALPASAVNAANR